MNLSAPYEMHITETEDGFRIDIRGDKDALRPMIFGRGRLRVFGGQHHFGEGHPFKRHEHGPRDEAEHPHSGEWRHHGRRFGRHHHHGHEQYDLGPWWDQDTPPDEAAATV